MGLPRKFILLAGLSALSTGLFVFIQASCRREVKAVIAQASRMQSVLCCVLWHGRGVQQRMASSRREASTGANTHQNLSVGTKKAKMSVLRRRLTNQAQHLHRLQPQAAIHLQGLHRLHLLRLHLLLIVPGLVLRTPNRRR